MKTIQMTIDDDLLLSVDQMIAQLSISRSAFIREALQMAIRRYRILEMEKQHAAGYAEQPVTEDEFAGWETIQAWGDE
ncbi:MAG: ribbon-helix-helix protein, CopG family [Caldilineaceae bacterium]|nr:ribbon-helix-helix protein, CopG family [Caldilineaceae bacterium]